MAPILRNSVETRRSYVGALNQELGVIEAVKKSVETDAVLVVRHSASVVALADIVTKRLKWHFIILEQEHGKLTK